MPDRYSARDLKHRIEILMQSKASDGGGGKTVTYVSTSPPTLLPALVQPRSAGETTYADQTSSFEGLTVVIRYRSGLNQTMRVAYGSRQFEIQGIVDLGERHRWMELTCEERLGE
jgi:SPP1 family predicted phage head-tail adaptor